MKSLPIQNSDFENLYNDFADFIKLKGYSRGKKTCYPSNVREFLFFIETRGVTEIKNVIAMDVVQYYEYLRERPNQRRDGGLSDSMISGHLFSLRLFFDYLMDMGEVTASPAHLPKFNVVKHKERQILTVAEIKEVNNACVTKMEKALIAIAYGCGLRRSEIEMLDTNDIMLHKGILLVRDGKFGKTRTVPLSDKAVKTLKEYIIDERPYLFPKQGMETKPAFFINKNGERMAGQYLGDVLKVILNRTQNTTILAKNITLHCLRHSIATHLLDNGADMKFVQEFLGHSMMDTSTLYSKRRKQRINLYNKINAPSYGSH